MITAAEEQAKLARGCHQMPDLICYIESMTIIKDHQSTPLYSIVDYYIERLNALDR